MSEFKLELQEREKTLVLNSRFSPNIEDVSGSRLLVARGKLIGSLKDRSLPEPLKWKGKVSEVQIYGYKEACRDLRGRQMLATGGLTSASCYLHTRDLRRPVTCFDASLHFITPERPNGNINQSISPYFTKSNFRSGQRDKDDKRSSTLPAVRSTTVQSLPSAGTAWKVKNEQINAKPVSLSQLHKLITNGNSLDEVMNDKPHVRISIKRTEHGNGEISPTRPKIQVMILNKQKSQVPSLPKSLTTNEIPDYQHKPKETGSIGSKENLLFDEWQFIPHFNQKDFLSQLDPTAIRALQRTRAWVWSIPLEGADDDQSESG